ncbi:MAG TPA: YceI family protein [bacterium]|nr:YceI family protein [bacterium]
MHRLALAMTTLALAAFTPVLLRADGGFSGNQLTKGYTPWYAKAAETAGQAPDFKAGAGSLFTLQAGSSLYLEGDSTLHKYQMRAGTLLGSAQVLILPGSSLSTLVVQSAALVVPLKDFKSKESGLDDNADKALKAAQNPEIRLSLSGGRVTVGTAPGSFTFTAAGTLTAAGQTAPVTLSADASFKDGAVRLQGVQKLKMTDFGVTPPSISLLVTSITCTNDIEIHYDVTFAPSPK